jgi:outer membrane lipoprotein-sorting protein
VKPWLRLVSTAALAAPLALAGCSLLPTTRHLPVPKAPAVEQTVTPEQLVGKLDQHWDALNTLTAKVTIQASIEKPKEGLVRDEPTIPGIILLRKPEMLRVYGQVPILGTRMFDMASDGKTFTLYIPSRNEAVKGPNSLTKKSPNQMENMRPGFFLDAMAVRGLDPDDFYTVTADSETIEDPSKKHLLYKQEYVLSIMRKRPDSHQETPVRVVTFDRSTLLPYEQDIYDNEGNLETRVYYTAYHDFGTINYPATITIERPLESYQIVLTIVNVTENQTLKDDEFVVQVPKGTEIKNLD